MSVPGDRQSEETTHPLLMFRATPCDERTVNPGAALAGVESTLMLRLCDVQYFTVFFMSRGDWYSVQFLWLAPALARHPAHLVRVAQQYLVHVSANFSVSVPVSAPARKPGRRLADLCSVSAYQYGSVEVGTHGCRHRGTCVQ